MKASAVLVVCLVLAAPAQAFEHGGPHPGFGHGHHHGHGDYGLGFWGGDYAPEVPAPREPIAAEAPDMPPPGVIAATIAAATALAAATPASGATRPAYPPPPPRGPHIIYLGERPQIHGPQVIYGNE
jgi:Spy/CpxP family protein refolding chaperone